MRRRWRRLASRYPCSWVEKAGRDLRLAELAAGEGFGEEAAFHAQQAVEKALKALITARGERPPKTHDIDVLLARLERLGVEVGEEWREEASALTAYGVEARYPGPPIAMEEAERAIDTARAVLEWVKEKLRELGVEC